MHLLNRCAESDSPLYARMHCVVFDSLFLFCHRRFTLSAECLGSHACRFAPVDDLGDEWDGVFVTAAAIWCLGLGLLELLTGCIHRLFGRKAGLADWKTALYRVLERLPSTAVLGAVLWVVWVIAFYHLGVGFYLISVPVGIAAHLLAASLYLSFLSLVR